MLFRDPAKTSTLQRLEDKTVFGGESVALPLASTVLLGGGALVITANPVVAAGFALLPIWLCVKNINEGMQRKIFHRRSGGCFAHLLHEQDLVALVREIGKDAVAAQLYEAIAHGQKLTPAAEELADVIIEKRPATTIKEMLAELDATPSIAFADDEVIEADAVTVEASTPAISHQPAQTPTVYKPGEHFDPDTGKGSIVLDLLIQSPGISRLYIGGQRTGKSYLAAAASRELVKKGWKVFHVNLASYGVEDDYYWKHVYKSVKGDLATITDADQANDLIANAIDLVTEFIGSQNAILLVDEVTFTGSKYGKWDASPFLRLVAEQISALTSTGMKRERAVWALCPELVAGAMKDEAKSIKSLNLTYIAIAPGMSVDWNNQKVKFDESVHQQVTANFKGVNMPTAEQVSICRRQNLPRIVYMNGEWLPIGDLPKIEQATAPLVDTELPQLYEAIARMTVAQTFEQPGTINPDGTKQRHLKNGEDFVEWFPSDEAMLSFIDWLATRKESGDLVTAEQVRGSYWAKKHGRDKSTLDRIFHQSVEYGFLIQKSENAYTIGDW